MVQATLAVDTMEDMYDAYRWFASTDYFRILKIDYQLVNDFKEVVLTFDFDEKVIGQMRLQCGVKPPQYESYCLLEQLENANSVFDFTSIILRMTSAFADQGLLVWETAGELLNIE